MGDNNTTTTTTTTTTAVVTRGKEAAAATTTANPLTTQSPFDPLQQQQQPLLLQLDDSSSKNNHSMEHYCSWTFGEHEACLHQIRQSVQASQQTLSTTTAQNNHNGSSIKDPSLQRWLFFGDSTMFRLFSYSTLSRQLVTTKTFKKSCPQLTCQAFHSGRCDLHRAYKLPFPPILDILKDDDSQREQQEPQKTWRRSPRIGEGPTGYGLEHPSCTDCHGCNSAFALCQPTYEFLTVPEIEICPQPVGGYFALEFTRDVEIQTTHYTTTQENLIHGLLQPKWNLPVLDHVFGPTICVMSAGFHDMTLPNITLSTYMTNVEWLLDLLLLLPSPSQEGEDNNNTATTVAPVCSYMIWLGNVAPDRRTHMTYAQKFQMVQEWNQAVLELLQTNPKYTSKSFFIDVFQASMNATHLDNVHMPNPWYMELSKLFLQLMDFPPSN